MNLIVGRGAATGFGEGAKAMVQNSGNLGAHRGSKAPSLFYYTGVYISSSHLDPIRTITSNPGKLCLASGSDDERFKPASLT